MAEYKVTTATATNLNGNLNVTTDSSATTNYLTFVDSTTTGNKSVKVSGNSPSFVPSTGNLAIQGTLYVGSGGVNITGITESTSTSTGAIINAGGLGIAKSIFSGNNIVTTGGSFYSNNVSTAGIARGLLHFRESNSLDRWAFGTDTAEAGTNTGSALRIWAYDDAGNYLNNPISFARATGITYFGAAIVLPTIGGTASSLDFYQQATLSTTFTDSSLTTGTIVFNLTRIGNIVTLTQQTADTTTSNYTANGAGYFTSNTAIPANFRPPNGVTFSMLVYNGGYADGYVTITTGGLIYIRNTAIGNFNASGQIGWFGWSVSWAVGSG